MSGIRFETTESKAVFLNPFKDFAEETQTIQVRTDPLLGDKSVFNPALKDKVKFFFADCDRDLVRNIVAESAKNCIFCGEKVHKNTPKYPKEIAAEGRIEKGESILFSNLFPIAKYHAVISLSKAHFLELSEFSREIIHDGLRAAQEFVKDVYSRDPEAAFVAVNANYLSPAGATLVHPHLQMLIGPTAYSYHERLLQGCRVYYQNSRSEYYSDLVRQEKESGSRYIAKRGRWHWMSSFSPIGNNEFISVHERENDFGELDDSDLLNLASGISKVLRLYEEMGHLSFNFSIYSARDPFSAQGFRCIIKIISRQNLYPNYRNDDYFLQKLLQTELIINLPEELSAKLKAIFQEDQNV